MAGVLWLGTPDCHDTLTVGPKAANLSRLAARHHVPSGFVVSGLQATTEVLPAPLSEAVVEAYRTLAVRTGSPTPRVAVRSSAIDEDGSAASFAGQHATFLNVSGEEGLLAAIVNCAASAGSETARAYREAREVHPESAVPTIAVLVQLLVEADAAFVAFSANPVTGVRDEVVINASWGLGESVVSGLVTPDMYVVPTAGDGEVNAFIADKRTMTVLTAGGTHEAPVPEGLRTQRCLDDSQVREVAALASALEQEMGWPVDIEGAFVGADLYLLQCRPITTLPKI